MNVRNDALTLPAWQLLAPQVAARLSGCDARARVARRQVVVRRVAVRAHGRGPVADAGGLAVEAVVERLVEVGVAVAAVGRHVLAHFDRGRRLDRVRLVAGRADGAFLAVAPQRAVRALVPLAEDTLVAVAAGLGALLVRRAGVRVGVTQDVVAAVAVTAGRGRLGEAGHEQRLGMHAREVTLHHLFVADAAVAHLVEVRHRRGGVVAAHGRVDAAVATLAGPRLAALDLGVHAGLERRDLVLVALHADVERHRAELVARVLGRERAGVALDAVDALVRPRLELGFVDRQRVAGVILHLGVVVALEALRVRDLFGLRRRCGGRIRDRGCGGFLGCRGDGPSQYQQQRGQAEDGDDEAKVAGPEHA